MRLPHPPVLLITDRREAKLPLLDVVVEAFEGGCRWVSLREKDMPHEERRGLLDSLVAVGRGFGATVGVHADIDAAVEAGLDALHLPAGSPVAEARRRLGPRILLGASTHDADEADAANRAGADYITYSPVFASISKPGYGRDSHTGPLASVVSRSSVPVIALGGIKPENARSCLEAGAAGVAVMGSVMGAVRPRAVMADLVAALG